MKSLKNTRKIQPLALPLAIIALLPLSAWAQVDVDDVLYWFYSLLNALIPIIISIGVIIFLWGVIVFMRNGDNPEERKKGASFMTWGIISIFVMVSLWGLVNILLTTIDLDDVAPPFPSLPSI